MDIVTATVTAVSIAIAAISLYYAYRSLTTGTQSIATLATLRGQMEELFERVKNTSTDTQDLISRIALLFDASEKAGLEMIYHDRQEALAHFSGFIRDEKENVTIVGSSLLGLSLYVTGFGEIVQANPKRFRFLMTHPEYSRAREGPEGRDSHIIEREIKESIHKLTRWGVPLTSIQLYRGSPCVFMISVSDRMLLNPYPYGTEAYRCFCIQVSSRGYIYKQYQHRHFERIWDSDWIETCDDFLRRTGEELTHSAGEAQVAQNSELQPPNPTPAADGSAAAEG
jgi:hypothetical protein